MSGPLLDRIDLQVEVAALSADEIASLESSESSAAIRERVEAARQIQRERFRRAQIQCNGEMATRHMRRHCELDPPSRRLLIQAIERPALSARPHPHILKLPTTLTPPPGPHQTTI